MRHPIEIKYFRIRKIEFLQVRKNFISILPLNLTCSSLNLLPTGLYEILDSLSLHHHVSQSWNLSISTHRDTMDVYHFQIDYLIINSVYGCSDCMYVCPPCLCSAWADQKMLSYSSRSVLTENCDLPCRCWELNPCPL